MGELFQQRPPLPRGFSSTPGDGVTNYSYRPQGTPGATPTAGEAYPTPNPSTGLHLDMSGNLVPGGVMGEYIASAMDGRLAGAVSMVPPEIIAAQHAERRAQAHRIATGQPTEDDLREMRHRTWDTKREAAKARREAGWENTRSPKER